VHLLPYMEQGALYNALDQAVDPVIPQYQAAADPSLEDKGANVQNFLADLWVFSDGMRRQPLRGFPVKLTPPHYCTVGLGNGFPDGPPTTMLSPRGYGVCTPAKPRTFRAAPDSPQGAFFGGSGFDLESPAENTPTGPCFQAAPPLKQAAACNPAIPQTYDR